MCYINNCKNIEVLENIYYIWLNIVKKEREEKICVECEKRYRV